MTSILAHVEEVPAVEPASDYIGNPMYGVIAEHAPALVAVLVLDLFAFVVARSARRDESRFAAVDARYRALTPVLRLLFWLLAVAAVVHAGLVFGHEPGFYTVAYATGAAAECWVALRLLNGSPWRGRTAIVLIGSLLAFSVSNFSGEPPDEVGIATKLVEIAALWIVVTAPFERRWRRAAGSGAMLVLSLVVFIGAWAGAFSGVEENYHVGEASQPGTLIPAGEDRPPTLHEIEDADELYEAVVAAVAKYEDPAVAATDGYAVDGMYRETPRQRGRHRRAHRGQGDGAGARRGGGRIKHRAGSRRRVGLFVLAGGHIRAEGCSGDVGHLRAWRRRGERAPGLEEEPLADQAPPQHRLFG